MFEFFLCGEDVRIRTDRSCGSDGPPGFQSTWRPSLPVSTFTLPPPIPARSARPASLRIGTRRLAYALTSALGAKPHRGCPGRSDCHHRLAAVLGVEAPWSLRSRRSCPQRPRTRRPTSVSAPARAPAASPPQSLAPSSGNRSCPARHQAWHGRDLPLARIISRGPTWLRRHIPDLEDPVKSTRSREPAAAEHSNTQRRLT